jgi:thiamine transporter
MYDVVVNDWGETTYVPTTLGNVVLALILIVLLIGAVFFAKKYAAKQTQSDKSQTSGKLTAKQLAFCAAAIALGTILSNIKLFHLPTGGSITLVSMLVVCLPGYFFGLGAGLLSAVAYGILQLLLGPYVLYPMQLVVDYILAFGALGLSGLFCNAKHGLIKGYLAGILGRYVFSVISGWIFFGSYAWEGWNALPYSLVYNALYIFAEAIITVIILLIPAVSKGLARVKAMALS